MTRESAQRLMLVIWPAFVVSAWRVRVLPVFDRSAAFLRRAARLSREATTRSASSGWGVVLASSGHRFARACAVRGQSPSDRRARPARRWVKT